MVEVQDALVMAAATLRVEHAIPYADAFAVATAQAHGTPLLIGDPELKGLKAVKVVWLGR